MTSGHPTFRVLVVEDSAVSRAIVGRALLARGHQVVAVETAEAALRKHAETPFPLMIVDWMLPGDIDGLKLVQTLRADRDNDDVVIVAVTGRNSMQDLEALLEAGASDFLPKPFEVPVLDTRLAVAERTVHERRLRRELQLQLSSLLDHMPDGVLLTDRQRRIQRVNRSLERMVGYTAAELVGRDVGMLYPDSVSYLEQVELQRQENETGVSHTQELRLRRKDGSPICVEVVRAPVEDSAVVGVVRDVTERNELRARLLLADRLASMGTLAAGVAHEINNPLTFIMGNLAYLAGELSDLPGDRGRELLQVIDEAQVGAERVRRIVRELRVFARGDEEHVGPIDVRETIDQAIVMAQNEIRHKARLVKTYEELPLVHASAGKLGQVFLNLLVNAAHAIPTGKAQHNEIRVRAFQRDRKVVVEVEDTGPGIAPELRERIFDPFFTTKPIGQGTGLGLAICHDIVTTAGGTIEVDSEVGVGTCFRVNLPTGAA